jgi:hypothetical protein
MVVHQVTSMDDHVFGLLRHERVHSYGHSSLSIAAVIESVTAITMLGYKIMRLCIHPLISICLGLQGLSLIRLVFVM